MSCCAAFKHQKSPRFPRHHICAVFTTLGAVTVAVSRAFHWVTLLKLSVLNFLDSSLCFLDFHSLLTCCWWPWYRNQWCHLSSLFSTPNRYSLGLCVCGHCSEPICQSVHPSFRSYCPRLQICLSVLPALPAVQICESARFHDSVSGGLINYRLTWTYI